MYEFSVNNKYSCHFLLISSYFIPGCWIASPLRGSQQVYCWRSEARSNPENIYILFIAHSCK
jgi:hypothetical protein